MSKSVVLSWELPTSREEGGPLAFSEIRDTQVELSLNGGVDYVPLDTVLPTDLQELSGGDLQYGTYYFKFVVTDIDGLSGAALEFPVAVPDDSAPGQVVNVQVVLS